ncbi:MAG: hypothetical protein MUF68_05770 [Cyclobacteriaceae bacterium]|jgi:hypothetical protein|nr:hypothetical protein [Cyclobacteriaceae bacterium]
MLRAQLTPVQQNAIKQSYLNVISLFMDQETVKGEFLRCLLKWGFQLDISPADLKHGHADFDLLRFQQPEDKVQKLESIYHLVYMINLDKVVEDVELEVASVYAKTLGFKENIVTELFKSIATAKDDGTQTRDVRQEVIDFLNMYQAG